MEPDSGESDYEGSEFAVSKAAIVLVKGLPSIRTFILNLPNMVVDRDAAGLLAAHSNDGIGRVGNNSYGIEEVKSIDGCTHFDAGHISSCIAAVRQFNGPSLVILQGLEEWLEDHGSVGEGGIDVGGGETCDERRKNLRSLCYYINCLRDADTLIVIPTVNHNVTPIFSERNKLSKQIRSITLEVPRKPSESDLRRSLSYLFRVVELALKKCAPVDLEMLPEDPAPPLPPSLEEIHTRRREELELWRRVEYRRKQLRYVLIRWLSQYLASKKFSILISADLDMTPSHDLYAHWQQHTRGRRIGLGDIMKKLERGEYNAISQYHDDIDMLVHNVRTFFRTRTVFDNRYRIRVLELKEMTVLNLYKINRNVVLFCEMHKDLACPSFSPLPSEASEEVPTATATLPASTSNNTATQRKTVQKPPRRRYGGARRRRNVRCARRQNSVPTTTAEPMRPVEAEVVLIGDASIGDDGDEADNDAEAPGGVENEGVKHGSSQEEEEGNSDGSWKKEESSCAIETGRADSSVGAGPEEERKNGGLTASGVVLKGDASAVGERLDYPTAAEDTSEWWVGAVLPSLRHFSFLQIHLVVQTAMRKLEMEVDNRRKQKRENHEPPHCTSNMSFNETSSMLPGSFFKWMDRNSVQKLKAVVW
ncbi:unnamed protein product [Trypanosoma congolense IL3000]|uniref:WGS project CAEQ00000000 data, annotated contig 576 n=1 Tax=Trypanosoma congolense (strain IL3000) TaxID=1068625 RepID=F9WGZ1_TRYCI|nr:unnamed protein product [Trypanosoma congolense IL3000]